MKKITFLIIISVLLANNLFGQKLKENEVDEFTNNVVKRTSWESLNQSMKFTAYFRISKINNSYYFDLKMMLGTGPVFSIAKDQELMFKLAGGEVVNLKNLEYTITCTGCGSVGLMGSDAQGIQVSYPINLEAVEKLSEETIEKFRIYTNDGYVENDLKSKIDSKIKKCLKLVE